MKERHELEMPHELGDREIKLVPVGHIYHERQGDVTDAAKRLKATLARYRGLSNETAHNQQDTTGESR
jgi:hypothetical protein